MGKTNWNGKKLYHYTDFNALKGILVNKEIWLGNVLEMNDAKEMKHFMSLLADAVIQKTQKQHKVHELFAQQVRRLEGMPVYATSLSRRCDDAAQWDRYGNAGKGVCIGFNAEVLSKCIQNNAVLQPVFYVKEVMQHEHVELISNYIMDHSDIGNWGSIDSIFENAWACSSAFKHKSFECEEEVRIMSLPFSLKLTLGEPNYLVSRECIREYYPLSLEDIDLMKLISKILLGPRATISLDILKRYMEKETGLDLDIIKIERSESPLR